MRCERGNISESVWAHWTGVRGAEMDEVLGEVHRQGFGVALSRMGLVVDGKDTGMSDASSSAWPRGGPGTTSVARKEVVSGAQDAAPLSSVRLSFQGRV
jgi:hypothetical protein